MSVPEEWSALLAVLERASSMSLSFRPAPARSEVERVESLTAAAWPDHLREFYSCHGGQSAEDFGALLPLTELFGLERVLEEHRMMVEISQQWIEHDPEHFSPNGAADLAGTEAGVFLPAYIPIGGEDGWLFFCDTRPGPNTGCIRWWGKYEADPAGFSWPSIADMIRAVRVSITGDSALIEFPGSAGWWPANFDGYLTWNPGGPPNSEEAISTDSP
jgi:cell wall assembly regulator SMI1